MKRVPLLFETSIRFSPSIRQLTRSLLCQMWIRVLWHSHPSASTKPALEIEDEIFQAGIETGVLIAKGSWFRTDPDAELREEDDMFFRMTFATASGDAIQEAVRRLGEALRAAFGGVVANRNGKV